MTLPAQDFGAVAATGESPAVDPAVRVEHIWKTYGNGRSEVLALADFSLDVFPGEFVCLLGASGCGKTTLLNLIAGIYHIDRGSVTTDGRRVGMVFQEPALFPWLTVRRNVETSMRFRRLHKHGRGSGWMNCYTSCTCTISGTAAPTNSPGGCSSAPHSPALSPRTPTSCSWTSRSERSTR